MREERGKEGEREIREETIEIVENRKGKNRRFSKREGRGRESTIKEGNKNQKILEM